MSTKPGPYLPPEILDYIIDLLHSEPETLKKCSLVSKSRIPRARMHLFARVEFERPSRLEAWKETFPDPANSPALHTRLLVVNCPEAFAVADSKEGDRPLVFPNLEKLELWSSVSASRLNLTPFHNFSPVLKSLRLIFGSASFSQVFDLIGSLPLLEELDLEIIDLDISDEEDTVFRPLTSPPLLAKTLTLTLLHDTEYAARRLLDLPNGLRFRLLIFVVPRGGDFECATTLVERSFDVLEYVHVECHSRGEFISLESSQWGWQHLSKLRSLKRIFSAGSIDFSKAIKLKEVYFRFRARDTTWVVSALKTFTSEHRDLRMISIYIPSKAVDTVDEHTHNQWMDLDRSLVQLRDSHPIQVHTVSNVGGNGEWVSEWIGTLFPETKKRGIIASHQLIKS